MLPRNVWWRKKSVANVAAFIIIASNNGPVLPAPPHQQLPLCEIFKTNNKNNGLALV